MGDGFLDSHLSNYNDVGRPPPKASVTNMKPTGILVAACTALLILCVAAQTPSPPASHADYQPVVDYDPGRDAAADIQQALAEAQRTNRNVLLEVGGDWCIWCHIMDKFFETHSDLLSLRESNYVWVKVNFSRENKNEQVLSQYPKIPGYPHLFVLGAQGQLLHSQSTAELEAGKSYNKKKFTKFLEKWVPATARK